MPGPHECMAFQKARFIAILTCFTLSGCILMYHYKTASVSVLDAETSAPIAGANVSIEYGYILSVPTPKAPVAVTDANGFSTMQVATLDERYNRVSAPGYIDFRATSPNKSPADTPMVFRLYKLPEPSLTFIVPDGYRGPVMLDLHPSDAWIQGNIGERQFTYTIPSSGYVSVQATPLLTRTYFIENVNFKTKNGIPIPEKQSYQTGSTLSVTEVGFEYPNNLQNNYRQLWVVGNKSDFDDIDTKINGVPNNRNFDHKVFNQIFDEAAAQPAVPVPP
jgi:hypothetical protein